MKARQDAHGARIRTSIHELAKGSGTKWSGPSGDSTAVNTAPLPPPKAGASIALLPTPSSITAAAGDGQAQVSWTLPEGEGGPEISYELAWRPAGGDWSAGGSQVVDKLSATVTSLENGVGCDFRVRAVLGDGTGPWSETVTVDMPPTLILALPDLELANGEARGIDMGAHFRGVGLVWEARVTTTHKRTGAVRTGAINTVARNKVGGAWSGDELTLTGGASGDHVLGVEVIATDRLGRKVSDSFALTVGTPALQSAPALILALPDLQLANGEAHGIDLGAHFHGVGLVWEARVTTTHKRTGAVRTGAINTVARNKFGGAWSGDELTLTGGASGHHVLGVEVIATDRLGRKVSDSFTLTVGRPAPQPAPTLILALPDLQLANGEVRGIDLGAHFRGVGLVWEARVTTTHKRMGVTRTAAINTVARNMVRGAWLGDELTLTGGASGHHVLGVEIIATDSLGRKVLDSFTLTVGTPALQSAPALQAALAGQARSLLEDASSVIGGRMASGGRGGDMLSALAGLLGGQGPGDCPPSESLGDCAMKAASGATSAGRFGFPSGRAGEPQAYDFSDLRDRARQGFAASLDRPLPEAGPSFARSAPAARSGTALTFWGGGSGRSE